MAQDTAYQAIPYVYQSRGLVARSIVDQAPEYTYLQLLNCQEREESSMSSRFGTTIINRDPNGTYNGQNYYFGSPVTSIATLSYPSNFYRYAGLQDGTLHRRSGSTQGTYTQIYSGLSGDTFQWLITNCYETSQAYLFIYDASGSVKDDGLFAAPQLTGIDPPPYTANVLPYSPLLTLIDNFATANTYTTATVSGSGWVANWAYETITTISAPNGGSQVTDFPQFLDVTSSGGPPAISGTETVTQLVAGSTKGSTVLPAFSSVPVSPSQVISLTVPCSGTITTGGTSGGLAYGDVGFFYSVDTGVTWTQFGAFKTANGIYTLGTYPLANSPYTWNLTISGLTNLNQLMLKVGSQAIVQGGPGITSTVTGAINNATVNVVAPGAFGLICDGMVSNLNTNTPTSLGIASVVSSGLSNGLYTTLTITTANAHGLTGTVPCSIYGCSNDLCDGFYTATVTGFSTLTVPYVSPVALSATGGYLNYVSTSGAPGSCVLANQYSTPYPAQMSAWGFYQEVPTATTSFPIGAWSGEVAVNSTVTVTVDFPHNQVANTPLDLNQNNQITTADLIVLTLNVGSPANIANIQLAFDVNSSGYTSSYYYANISPAYYQGNIAGQVSAYESTQSQILADTLGLVTGQPLSSTTAQLQPSNFSTGDGAWTAVLIPIGNFLPVGSAGQSGIDWSNITGWRLTIETVPTAVTGGGSSTVACNGLYLQWGYGPSSFAGTGYDWRYTYYNAATGTESSPSPIQNFSQQYGYLSSLAAPFYLRQAAQVTGQYSSDSQVTHLRMYRRGGVRKDNWLQIDQVPNITAGGSFLYKDVVADATLAQAQILILDNDPPVTSSLVNPILTTLSAATSGPGQSVYSTYAPQVVQVADATATFVTDQTVLVGNAYNLEEVLVTDGGTGQFTAILRLQHNAGEQVQVNSVPRQPCDLCALAYGDVYLAGDVNNPHYLYKAKKGFPENFSPADYIPVSSPDDPIMAVINWRGTLVVATLKTWWIVANGARQPQPTGCPYGLVAKNGWALVGGAIVFQAADGLRLFVGADGEYMTLPVEWIFRNNPLCLPPQLYQPDISQGIISYFNNCTYLSYVSNNNGAAGQRYRLVYDHIYKRFRYDDVQATAMFWEKETNSFLVGKEISAGNYAVVEDWTNDYDDGGWNAGALVETPINMLIQSPYRDLGKPHYPKQWNMLQTDVNTMGQNMTTQILFEDGAISQTLATQNTGTVRKKVQFTITDSNDPTGGGQQAYRASILHQIQVTSAPILYQEDIYAAVLADYNSTYDSYWIKFGTDASKFVKQGYFDYTSAVAINVSLFADNNNTAYWTFTLPAQSERSVQRVRFGNVNPGTTAFTLRTWRIIMNTQDATQPFQLWKKPRIEWKPVDAGSTYAVYELEI